MWPETCPDQLIGLVDAVRLCNQQVKHPLILRSTQRPVRCTPECSNSRNLRVLATELVTIVSQNRHYTNILRWSCPSCSTNNIGTNSCSSCPPDPFQNTTLLTLLGKAFNSFFKSLVSLIGTNPPINYAPEQVTNYRLIETILSSHGIKWGRLIPIDYTLPYKCSCVKPHNSAITEVIPHFTIPILDNDEEDLLLLDLSSESLYKVGNY